MRDYGQIQCSYWTDPDVQSMSDQGKLLGAYILTGPHSNGLGCYRLPFGYIMADFGWDAETVSKAFGELFEKGFMKRCECTEFVLVPKYLKWNPISNGNVASARVKEFDVVPKKFEHYQELIADLKEFGKHWPYPFGNRLETLSKGYGKQEPNLTEPNQSDTSSDESSPEEIKILLKDGTDYTVPPEDIEEYTKTYTHISVMQTLKEIRLWCKSNKQKCKTRTGAPKFINNWLARNNREAQEAKAKAAEDGVDYAALAAKHARPGETLEAFKSRWKQ